MSSDTRAGWEKDLPEWVAAVDVEASAGYQRGAEPAQRELPGIRVATVEGADPHGKREVVRSLIGAEHEVFAGDRADAQHAVGDQVARCVDELTDRRG